MVQQKSERSSSADGRLGLTEGRLATTFWRGKDIHRIVALWSARLFEPSAAGRIAQTSAARHGRDIRYDSAVYDRRPHPHQDTPAERAAEPA
jgi:hypothetical protein